MTAGYSPRLSVLLLIVLAMFCSASRAGGAAADDLRWDQDSWRDVIAHDCSSFFDGCNNCRRAGADSSVAACTRKACAVYQKPRCLDAEANAESPAASRAPKTVSYACAGDNRVSVFYHEYFRDGQRVGLNDSEVVFRDHQTQAVYRLRREVSASGEKYVNATGLVFFAKGDEAFVQQQQTRLYRDCVIEP